MDFKLDIDYIVDDADRKNPNFETNPLITITLLRTAIERVKGGSQQREGLKSREAVRAGARVTNAITRANNAKASVMTLDLNEVKYIQDVLVAWMKEIGIPGLLSGWVEDLLTYVDRLVTAGEEQAAEARKKPEAKSVAEAKPPA